jgi:ribulose-phosphate 3-epimerase
MKLVVPTVTAITKQEYEQQTELIASFSNYAHIDLAEDGFHGSTKLISPKDIYLEPVLTSSVHIMFEDPLPIVEQLIKLSEPPKVIILQVESNQDKLLESIKLIHDSPVLLGLAVLQSTDPKDYSSLISMADQVLIFSGNLGQHGGIADLSLTSKVQDLKKIKSKIEIAWDGGINRNNIEELSKAGVDIFYVGGAIHNAENPAHELRLLQELAEKV